MLGDRDPCSLNFGVRGFILDRMYFDSISSSHGASILDEGDNRRLAI